MNAFSSILFAQEHLTIFVKCYQNTFRCAFGTSKSDENSPFGFVHRPYTPRVLVVLEIFCRNCSFTKFLLICRNIVLVLYDFVGVYYVNVFRFSKGCGR